jgi:uncharacterized protein
MAPKRLFLDTFFAIALLNKDDASHAQAVTLWQEVKTATEVWLTEAILIEIGNTFSRYNRLKAVDFIKLCYRAPNFKTKPVDKHLIDQAINYYERRNDKTWGLTDCISFVVMEQLRIKDVVSGAHHFEQAGFHLLMK